MEGQFTSHIDGRPEDGPEDFGELGVLARKAAGLGVRGLAEDDLLSMVEQVETAHRALDAAMAHALGELEARGTTDRRFGHHTKGWLGTTHGLHRTECARRMRVASVLRSLPAVDAALSDGRITTDHARVIADAMNPRVVDLVIEIAELLVDMAQGVRFETWAAEVRDLLRAADPDGGHDPSPSDNRLTMDIGMDASLHLEGTLVGDWATTFRHAVEARADQLFERYTRDRERAPGDLPIPTRSALRAMALAELCREGLAAGATGSAPAVDVTLVIPGERPDDVRTADGHHLHRHTADTLCCDPKIRALVIDSLGVPLDLGREIRLANRDQRRAVHRRDGGCVFPGCDAPAGWTDVHHVIHFEHDGPTDIANLACLCRHHHGVVHRRGWSMRTTEGQWFEIRTPSGGVLQSQRHGRQRQPG